MKQKTISKAIAVLIILTFVLMGINLPAFATITESTNTGTITVSGVEEGVAISIYQLVKVNYNYSADQPTDTPYEWVEEVKAWLETNETYKEYAEDLEKFSEDISSNSSEAAAFYSALAAAIKGGDISISATSQTADSNGNATFSSCQMGIYLVLIENGLKVYTPSVVTLVPEYNEQQSTWELNTNVAVNVKSTDVTITKTLDGDKTEDNYSTADDMSFTIKADVPKYEEGSLSTDYYIYDTLTGLNLTGDIRVTGVKGTVEVELTADTDYTLTKTDSTFTLKFVYDQIKSYDTIKVEYKAKLVSSSSLVLGENGNTNNAYLYYSNNPYDSSSHQTQSSENKIYTYGITINKQNSSGETITTDVATFKLSTTEGGEALTFTKGSDGVYYYAGTSGSETPLETSNGKIEIKGLDEGTYYLQETKAPSGYVLSNTIEVITLTDEAELDGLLDNTQSAIYTINFVNKTGFSLPTTGGLGTIIFAAAGVVLIGAGLSLIIMAKRKKQA